jgi:hypothetical protein
VSGALCGLVWECGFASDTFTNAYIAVSESSAEQSFMSISRVFDLKLCSAICPYYCFSLLFSHCCAFGRLPESTHSGGSQRIAEALAGLVVGRSGHQ